MPAGFRTDHPGMGLCVHHEPTQVEPSPGKRDAWDTTPPSLQERASAYAADPAIFDIRREMGLVRATIEDLAATMEVNGDSDVFQINALKGLVDTLGKAQERAIHILATKQFYLTMEQVSQIVMSLVRIWNVEADKLLKKYPSLRGDLLDMKNSCAKRIIEELDVPQPPLALQEGVGK